MSPCLSYSREPEVTSRVHHTIANGEADDELEGALSDEPRPVRLRHYNNALVVTSVSRGKGFAPGKILLAFVLGSAPPRTNAIRVSSCSN